MSHTLKVRDRTTNKVREASVDQDAYDRLKGYTYLTDKNSKEPFRETTTADGKRPRIALKRDVMNFSHGDPRRVCYVDKANMFDCRKANLKTKASEPQKMVKVVKTVKVDTPTVGTKATVTTPTAQRPVIITPDLVRAEPTRSDLEFKRSILAQIDQNKLVDLIPTEALLAAWAETHGYEKKQA